MSGKLAVFFPGIGYTLDKPLLYYSRRLAEAKGYGIRLLPYGGFPPKITGDRDRMKQSFEIALFGAEAMLSEVDLAAFEEILFVGKSIGTVAAAAIAEKSPERARIRLILYTPLEETFSFAFGSAAAFTGTMDQWTGREKSRIPALCRERDIPCTVIPEGNHSLETGHILRDIENMRLIMERTADFMG